MTIKNEYSQAVELIQKGKVENALKMVESLSFDRYLDFIHYCKEKRSTQFQKAVFWLTISKSKFSSNFFSFKEAPYILSDYFKNELNTVNDKEFILWLADNYPDLLIKCLRTSRLLIDENKYNALKDLLSDNVDLSLKKHFQFMDLLRMIENQHWEEIKSKGAILEEYQKDFITLLAEIGLWYELKFNDLEKTSDQTKVAAVSFLIEYFLSKYSINSLDKSIDFNMLNKKLINSLVKISNYEKAKKNSPIFELLNSVFYWHTCYYDFIEVYFFDLNFEPQQSEDGCFYLVPNDILKLKKWYQDGHKINFMFSEFHKYGEEFYEENESIQYTEEIANGLTEAEYEYFSSMSLAASCAWKKTFGNDITKINKKSQSINEILSFFTDYSGKCRINWLRNIELISFGAKQKLCSHINSVHQHLNDMDQQISWIRLDSYQILKEIITKSNKYSNADDILSLIIFEVENVNKVNFDRFNPQFDLWLTPFLKFDDKLLCFTSIIANTRPLTLIFNNLLSYNKSKVLVNDLSNRYEDTISIHFEDHGYSTFRQYIAKKDLKKTFHNTFTGEKGDIDSLAYKDGVLFIIEAKLASLREKLHNAYSERSTSFVKGASQLNKIKRYIRDCFNDKDGCVGFKSILNIKEESFDQLKIIPLIISTSFESDHEMIKWGECENLKISWYEMMILLGKDFSPIKIADIIENNLFWEILNKLPTPSLTEKKIPVGYLNLEEGKDIFGYSHSALELYEKEKFQEAIPVIIKCIECDSSDADNYILLADCYAFCNMPVEAEANYKLAIDKDLFFAKAYANYGVFLQRANSHAEALNKFIRAFDLKPNDIINERNLNGEILNAKLAGVITDVEAEKLHEAVINKIQNLDYLDSVKMV